MATKTSERVLKMKENFWDLPQQVHKTPAYWERQEASMKANGEDIAKGFDSILESISGIQGTTTKAINTIDAELNNDKGDFEK